MNDRIDTAQYQRLAVLFDRAVVLDAAEQSELLLATERQDADLAQALAILLAADARHHPGATEQSDRVLQASLDAIDAPGIAVGDRVGPYVLREEIGRGGMGVVFRAERADGQVQQQVALKIVKRARLDASGRERFLREREIVATFQHPSIARMLDVGQTDDGSPWLAMELIRGQPITRYCDANKLDMRRRIEVFLRVCEAVQHAHANLVLHRDLKPSNVLVGEDGLPKLIDFGIAKPLGGVADDAFQQTATAQRFFSPSNVAPEQLRGERVGVACDVYQLATLLHELLCGGAVFDAAGLTPGQFEQRVLDVAPEAPSARAVDASESTAQAHGVATPSALSRELRGDLDAIVALALRKRPTERYGSVEQLADDLRLYLDGRPVLAQRGRRWYRARKYIRRNLLAITVVFVLLGGLCASLRQAHIVNEQHALAEQRFEDVRGLAHAMLYDLNDELAKLPGSTKARSTLVQEALVYLQKLSAQKDTSLPLRREIASAWLRVGDVQDRPGMPNIEDLHGALTSYAQASTVIDSILRAVPGDRDARVLQAEVLLAHADVLCNNYALTEANADYRRDVTLWTDLRGSGVREAGPGLAKAQAGVGRVLFMEIEPGEALRYYMLAQATMEAAGPVDGQLAYGLFLGVNELGKGEALDWLGRMEESRASIRHGLGRLQLLQQSYPDYPQVRHAVALAWMKLAENSYDLKDKTPVLTASENAHAILATEAAADPADMRGKQLLALSDQEIGDSLVDLKRFDEALNHYHSALQGEQEIAARDRRDEDVRQDLGNTWYGIAELYQARQQRDLATAAFRQTVSVRQALVSRSPNAVGLRRDLAQALGDLASNLPDKDEACRMWIASDATWETVMKNGIAAPTDQSDIARARQRAAACRRDGGDSQSLKH